MTYQREMGFPINPTKEDIKRQKQQVAKDRFRVVDKINTEDKSLLVVKASRLQKLMVCYGRSNIKIFWDEIMGLKKGDTAEITGTWGPHDMYLDVKIHKYRHNITLTEKEVEILFDIKQHK